MRINTNVASLVAQESSTQTNKNIGSSLEKLSSGLRINKASDDASGLAIADKLRTQASSLGQSISNANSAVSLTQIADKAMAEISNIIDIIKQKAIQANTSTTSSDGRTALNNDVSKLTAQITNIVTQTNYNGEDLLKMDSAGMSFQVGEKNTNNISLAQVDVQLTALGIDSIDVSSVTGSGDAMALLDTALTTLNTARSTVGSAQNQLESSIRNMATTQTNIKAAESTIRDVDYAQESANFNKQNIIAQAGTYAMSQANAAQQNVLKLLQ